MGKRKLRNCTNCGTRHGPPTGKNCGRKEDREQESTEKIVDEAELGASAILSENDKEVSAAFASADLLQDGVVFTDVNLPKRQWSPLMCASKEGTGDRPRSPAGSVASGAMFLRQQLRVMQQERQQFESRIDGRIMHMENVLGKVAGVQQAQLSITCEENKAKMDKIVSRELDEGMISLTNVKPTCIHALGAVPKNTGGITLHEICNLHRFKFCVNMCKGSHYHHFTDIYSMFA